MNAVSWGVQFNGIIAATAPAIAQTKHTNIVEEKTAAFRQQCAVTRMVLQ